MTPAASSRAAARLLILCALSLGAQMRDPLPVPDVSGFRTLKGDFHIHTVFSDGEVWPVTRVEEAWRQGLDAIALSDHVNVHPHEPDVSADLRRPYEVARASAERLGIILIQGVEIAEGNLHCNALFVSDPNAFEGLGLQAALRKARNQDAFVFWNHPGWKQAPRWFPLIASAYEEKLINGMELVNGLTFYSEAYPWIEEKKLTILANSDVHAPIAFEYHDPRTRPITLVFARTADAGGVREALLARRTAAWMGGEVWGAEEFLNGFWERSIEPGKANFRFTRGTRSATLQIRNRFAIPYLLHVAKTVSWLAVGAGEIPAEGVAAVSLALLKDAPEGMHSVELEFEVTNLHVAPRRNLTVRLPITVEITE
jgi:3',5'-nucleoside bisphosphate phosphatase